METGTSHCEGILVAIYYILANRHNKTTYQSVLSYEDQTSNAKGSSFSLPYSQTPYLCVIWSSHDGEYEDYSLLVYDLV
jgi:hypothetical protein